MQSIISYKDRGPFGNPTYRGNCSGYVIKDLIQHFYPSSKPRKFIEIFSRRRNRRRCSKRIKNRK